MLRNWVAPRETRPMLVWGFFYARKGIVVMLDIKFVRENLEYVIKRLETRMGITHI